MEQQHEFPASSYFEGYVRRLKDDDGERWALFDCDGIAVCVSDNRSTPFYFAVQHEITIRMLN